MPSPLDYVDVELNIKNMVSKSCLYLVRITLQEIEGLEVSNVKLGVAKVRYPARKFDEGKIDKALSKFGFKRINNSEEKLVEQIKIAAIELIHYAYNTNSLIRNSDYLSEKLGQPYGKLSRAFSETTGVTLERYLILLKIEKVKELVINNEHTLSEIAYMMGYSSVHYLSNQFKQVVGMSVSQFKKSPDRPRIPLEEIIAR